MKTIFLLLMTLFSIRVYADCLYRLDSQINSNDFVVGSVGLLGWATVTSPVAAPELITLSSIGGTVSSSIYFKLRSDAIKIKQIYLETKLKHGPNLSLLMSNIDPSISQESFLAAISEANDRGLFCQDRYITYDDFVDAVKSLL